MNRKPCFDEKCIKCIQNIVKKQLSDCSMMDVSMCVGSLEVNGDLTVNGNVYYETLNVANTCIDNLHLGTIYLQSDCDTMTGNVGTTGQVLISQGGKENTWLNSSELIGTLDQVLQRGHTSYSTNIDMSGNNIQNVNNLNFTQGVTLGSISNNLYIQTPSIIPLQLPSVELAGYFPVNINGNTYYLQLYVN
jgi:hypothetical protein